MQDTSTKLSKAAGKAAACRIAIVCFGSYVGEAGAALIEKLPADVELVRVGQEQEESKPHCQGSEKRTIASLLACVADPQISTVTYDGLEDDRGLVVHPKICGLSIMFVGTTPLIDSVALWYFLVSGFT